MRIARVAIPALALILAAACGSSPKAGPGGGATGVTGSSGAPTTRPHYGGPSPTERPTVDPGTLPQTRAVPSDSTAAFRARMEALWRGIVDDSVSDAMPAFFPRSAYLQVKAISNAGADYQARLVGAFGLDIHAAHVLLGSGAPAAKLVSVSIPHQWTWIQPGGCYNRIGYWHAPGARLVYREGGQVRSFGVFSFISWRGEWYVVHLSSYSHPGTVDSPSVGVGSYGPPGGC